jgi:hypothetical protein
MSMRDAFSGLFPSNGNQGIARVSGVAQAETVKIPRALSETPPRNTSVAENEVGVSALSSATPDHAHSNDGGVARKIKETQWSGEDKTPATPETPPKQNASVDFPSHAARFCALPRPAMYSAERWGQIQADAKQFSHLWGSQVSALGWQPDDVFAIPDGLIPLIEGGEILAVCEKTAVVRASNRKQFNTIRFAMLPGEIAPRWRVWASWCEP